MVALIREESGQDRQKKGAKTATPLVCPREPVSFEKPQKELLRQILRSMQGVPASTDEVENGPPVRGRPAVYRFELLRPVQILSSSDHAPSRLGKKTGTHPETSRDRTEYRYPLPISCLCHTRAHRSLQAAGPWGLGPA